MELTSLQDGLRLTWNVAHDVMAVSVPGKHALGAPEAVAVSSSKPYENYMTPWIPHDRYTFPDF